MGGGREKDEVSREGKVYLPFYSWIDLPSLFEFQRERRGQICLMCPKRSSRRSDQILNFYPRLRSTPFLKCAPVGFRGSVCQDLRKTEYSWRRGNLCVGYTVLWVVSPHAIKAHPLHVPFCICIYFCAVYKNYYEYGPSLEQKEKKKVKKAWEEWKNK